MNFFEFGITECFIISKNKIVIAIGIRHSYRVIKFYYNLTEVKFFFIL